MLIFSVNCVACGYDQAHVWAVSGDIDILGFSDIPAIIFFHWTSPSSISLNWLSWYLKAVMHVIYHAYAGISHTSDFCSKYWNVPADWALSLNQTDMYMYHYIFPHFECKMIQCDAWGILGKLSRFQMYTTAIPVQVRDALVSGLCDVDVRICK